MCQVPLKVILRRSRPLFNYNSKCSGHYSVNIVIFQTVLNARLETLYSIPTAAYEIGCTISPILETRTLKLSEVNLSFITKVMSSRARLFSAFISQDPWVVSNWNRSPHIGMCWKDFGTHRIGRRTEKSA